MSEDDANKFESMLWRPTLSESSFEPGSFFSKGAGLRIFFDDKIDAMTGGFACFELTKICFDVPCKFEKVGDFGVEFEAVAALKIVFFFAAGAPEEMDADLTTKTNKYMLDN